MTTGTDPRRSGELCRCLEHPVRRAVLRALLERRDESTTLDALVDAVVERTGLDADRLRVELHHVHLPALGRFDALEFDYRSGAVRFHPESAASRFAERELAGD